MNFFASIEESNVKHEDDLQSANCLVHLSSLLFIYFYYEINSLQEHTVVESKPDHFLDDLRLNNPWPELRRYAVCFSIYYLMLIW